MVNITCHHLSLVRARQKSSSCPSDTNIGHREKLCCARKGQVATSADDLRDLARRVRRLLPDRHDPEAFHIEKDEIAHDLRRLAATMEGKA